MADRIWAGTRALAQMHLDAGQRVWLVTATPVELAQIIARRLGLTGALGTVAESVDGVYTGRLVGEVLHGPAKAHAVRALAVTRGPRPAPLHGLLATRSTTCRCCPRSGTAVAVNPDSRPARHRPRPRLGDPRLPHRAQGAPRASACRRAARRGRGGRRGGRGPAPLALAAAATAEPTRWTAAQPLGRRCGGWREQAVEGVLDGLAHLVGEVEHEHRVVRRVRAELVGRDRLAELDVATSTAAERRPAGRAAGTSASPGSTGRPSSRASGLTSPIIG